MEAKQPSKKKVRFELTGKPGQRVFVAGTFNEWSPKNRPLKAVGESGRYVGSLLIPVGRHEYKFVVDGEWQVDPGNSCWVPNGLGSLNSVVEV